MMELRLIVSEVDGECGDGAGKESCRGCWMEWRLMVSAEMEQGRSHAVVAGGKLMELQLMVSAGMEQGRSHVTVAGGKMMEL